MRRDDLRAILNGMNAPAGPLDRSPKLRRTLTLPWLVFYGVGVTVGAGIFALIGEILRLAGDLAPLSFLVAGVIAGATGLSYALLARVYPRAGGEAVFVNRGLGRRLGWAAGAGVAATGVISSAVIALAFAGYASTLAPVPQPALVAFLVAALGLLAAWGIRESVLFAALVTFLEVGTLAIVMAAGLPSLGDLPAASALLGVDRGWTAVFPVSAAAIIAFFAFIGFEDIENMAEETVHPSRNVPLAIFWTLGVTVVIYVTLALIATAAPGRAEIAASPAPMALLFERVTGLDGRPVAAMAAIAMVNGILIQIVMASRVLYGMAQEGLAPAWLGDVHESRRTPVRATFVVVAAILALAFAFPLVRLAEATSMVVLAVFALVNLSLYALGSRDADPRLARWRWWGLFGAALCAAIFALEGWRQFAGM